MFDGTFVFKNARLHKIVIKAVEFKRKDINYRYSFGRNNNGVYAVCKLDTLTYQPTDPLTMSQYIKNIVDNEFCSSSIEPNGTLVVRIKKPYRFNPFLVLNGQYVKEWGRLFNGLSYTFKLLDNKAVLHGGLKHNPDANLLSAYVLDAMFQRVIDPDNNVYLQLLTKEVHQEQIEAFTIQGIAASCLFSVTLKNVLTVIRGMYA